MPEKQEEENIICDTDEPVPGTLANCENHRCRTGYEAQNFNPSHEKRTILIAQNG
jgi:hypothetical protein